MYPLVSLRRLPSGTTTRNGSLSGVDTTNEAGVTSLTWPQRTTVSEAFALIPMIAARIAMAKSKGKSRM